MARRLKLFRITGEMTNLDRTLERFVDFDCIQAVESKVFVSSVHGLNSISSENPWRLIAEEIQDIEKNGECKIDPTEIHTIDYSYENIKSYVHSTHEKLKKLNTHKKAMQDLKKKYVDALTIVRNIIELEIPLDDIFSCDYVETRFGKLPMDSLEILKLYDTKPIIFQAFKEEKKSCWCMYMTTTSNLAEIDNIFSSMFFQRIYVPDLVKGKPEENEKSLLIEIKVSEDNINEIKDEIQEIIKENLKQLSDIKGEIIFLDKIYNARKYVVDLGEKYNITGFVADQAVESLLETFNKLSNTEVEIMPTDMDKRLKVPRRIKGCKK